MGFGNYPWIKCLAVKGYTKKPVKLWLLLCPKSHLSSWGAPAMAAHTLVRTLVWLLTPQLFLLDSDKKLYWHRLCHADKWGGQWHRPSVPPSNGREKKQLRWCLGAHSSWSGSQSTLSTFRSTLNTRGAYKSHFSPTSCFTVCGCLSTTIWFSSTVYLPIPLALPSICSPFRHKKKSSALCFALKALHTHPSLRQKQRFV